MRSLNITSTRARRALNQESTAAPLAQLRPPLCPAEHTLADSIMSRTPSRALLVAHTIADSIMSLIQSRAFPSVPVPRTPVRARTAHSRPHPRCAFPSFNPAEHTLAVSTPLSPAPRSYTAARDRIALPAGACRRSFLTNFREAVADCLAA